MKIPNRRGWIDRTESGYLGKGELFGRVPLPVWEEEVTTQTLPVPVVSPKASTVPRIRAR